MKIFNPHKLVLFKKQDCAPCLNAAMALDKVLEKHPEFRAHVSQLWQENHSSLVATYSMDLFPTLLILDNNGLEITRKVGAKELSEDFWWKTLTTIHHKEKT